MFTLRWQDGSGVFIPGTTARWSSAHATTARRFAAELAAERNAPISVVAGERVAYVMQPDGTRKPPPDAVVAAREDCTRGERPCFCSACRAERREARHA